MRLKLKYIEYYTQECPLGVQRRYALVHSICKTCDNKMTEKCTWKGWKQPCKD